MSFQLKLGIACSIAVFLALLLWPLLGFVTFYFDAPLVPVGDFAANDLLVIDAKQFILLHGHYSRMGFFHPGPFYLYAFALGETLFVDMIPLFGSTMAAHSMTATFLMSLALSLYFYVWFRCTNRKLSALLATGTMMACLSLAETHYLTAPWTPVMLTASMIFLITGLIGWYLLHPRWILLALFGVLQLIHGHASFLGLLPLMLVVTAAVLGFRNVLYRLTLLDRRVIISGGVLLCIFLTPMALNTLLHWPGDWPLYLQQADKRQQIALAEKLSLAASFIAFGLGGLALLYQPVASRLSSSPSTSNNLTRLSVAIFSGASISLLLLVLKAVDDTSNQYLLFWFIPAGALISATGILHVLNLLPAKLGRVYAFVVIVLLAYLAASSIPFRAYNFVRGTMLERVYQDAKQLSQTTGKSLWITLDKRQNQSLLWKDTLALLSKMKRDDAVFACIDPHSWNISFTQWARCNDQAPGTFLNVTLAYISIDSPGPLKGAGELRLSIDDAESHSQQSAAE